MIQPHGSRSWSGKGIGGILISVAKIVLTTLCAGIHPSRTLPVVLDCSTDVFNFSFEGKRPDHRPELSIAKR